MSNSRAEHGRNHSSRTVSPSHWHQYDVVENVRFDKLWIQFYNNPYCSPPNAINYDDWKSYIAGTPSANAKLYIGVPAAPDGATGTACKFFRLAKPLTKELEC